MTDRRFIDTLEIANTKVIDGGDLLIEAACARTGCQQYRANEIGLMGDEAVNVYRAPDVVFDRDSMASYAGRPVTIGHPKEPVTSANWKDHAVGEVQDEIARDGETVRVTFRVRDAAAIKAIQDGTREISMGYSTPIVMDSGTAPDGQSYRAVQAGPIKINHLAIVDKARGGSELRIGDGAEEWGVSPVTYRADKQEAKMPDALTTMMVDGFSIEVTDQAAQAIKKLQDQASDAKTAHDAEVSKLQGQLADAKKEVETKDGELKAVKKDLADKTSPAALADMAKKRAKTVDAGKKSGMTEEEMEELDDAAIQRRVVTKHLGDGEAKGMSDAEISGAFRSISKAPPSRRTDDALGGGLQTQDADPWAFIDADKKKGA
ncbi:MAG: DUF2213 domain-containing protein [Pseudomonadota bacterium]